VKIPFLGTSGAVRSVNADQQRTLNCYLEMDNGSPRAPVALYGTPGLVLRATLGGAVRGCIAEGGYTWWVGGNTVYRMSSAYAVTTVGTIGTSTGEVGIASNGAQLLIVDGSAGYIVTVASATIGLITDSDFPNGVQRTTYQDGYFAVTGKAGSPSFWINQTPYAGTSWDALDFASSEGSPDNTIGIISDHRELWLFGEKSAEVWVNTGSSDFPFARSGNAFIEHGCAAAGTIAKADNTVFWLGADDKGQGIVWRADGYTPVRISTHAMEKALGGYTVASATALTYQQEGHVFYVLNFPEATWVYDASTQVWHERAYMDPATSALSRWRGACHCYLGGSLVGDYTNGKVYSLDLDTYTDAGDAILRLRTAQTLSQDQAWVFFPSMQVDMETGVGLATGQGSDPLLMLRFSDDGHTWSNVKTATIGKVGEYGARAKFNRLGRSRNRTWEISMTDPVRFAVFGAVVA